MTQKEEIEMGREVAAALSRIPILAAGCCTLTDVGFARVAKRAHCVMQSELRRSEIEFREKLRASKLDDIERQIVSLRQTAKQLLEQGRAA